MPLDPTVVLVAHVLHEHRASREWMNGGYVWYCRCNATCDAQYDLEMHQAEMVAAALNGAEA